jgi:hypothetical protein
MGLQALATAQFKYEKNDQTKPPYLEVEVKITPEFASEHKDLLSHILDLFKNEPTISLINGVYTVTLDSLQSAPDDGLMKEDEKEISK